ncbi:histidine kinase [Actinocrispum sp. NPDC049592]|uniref:sensor histidine kinase n=1 Tax=Actinocrispum sp. NPDC049592 TaxID=3154835 RepID=UPI0034191F4E
MVATQPSTSAQPRALVRARGPYVAARVLPVAFLGALLLARCSDGLARQEYGHLPFILAVFVLPLWYASGFARRPWQTAPWALLAVQAVLTYLPFALFGSHWVGGVSGLLVGLVLLLVPRPWPLAALLMAVEGVLWNVVVGVPYLPQVNSGIWVLVAAADGALGLFGLIRLAQVVGELRGAQHDLATAAVLRERLAVGERLVGAVEERVRLVARHARAALRWLSSTPEDARAEVAAAGRIAREAISEGRRIYAEEDRFDEPALPERPMPTPRVARAVLAIVLALFSVQNLLNFAAPTDVAPRGYDRTLTFVVVVLASVLIPVLHWRHSGPVRPRLWPLSLTVLAVLCYLQFVMVGSLGLIFVSFLGGSLLLLVTGPWRWVLFAAAVLSAPALAWQADPTTTAIMAWAFWAGYLTATMAAFGLMTYGLSRLTGLAGRLAARRDQFAQLATISERLRLARDTHDLLGLGMSTLALKTDLVAALIGRDDQRAARELGEVVSLCATVGADAGRIVGERPELSLVSEVSTATDVLESSGIDVFTEHEPVQLTGELDTVLAIVLREAVTNILRHSAAQRCAVTLADGRDTVTLRITNDGAASPPADTRGRGLDNMRARVEALGGTLTTRHDRGTFVVVAEVPHA